MPVFREHFWCNPREKNGFFLPKKSILWISFDVIWFLSPKDIFRTVFFFFRNKKTSSFPPKRIQVSKFPHLPFRTPRPWRTWYLEQQIFSDEMMWLQWLTTGMLSVTVVIPATSDSILIDTSHLCFLLSLRCDMQGVYSDSFSWDKVCFVPWTRNLWISKPSIPFFTSYFFSTYKLQGSKWNNRISRKSRCWRETFEFPRIEMPETLWAMQLSQF